MQIKSWQIAKMGNIILIFALALMIIWLFSSLNELALLGAVLLFFIIIFVIMLIASMVITLLLYIDKTRFIGAGLSTLFYFLGIYYFESSPQFSGISIYFSLFWLPFLIAGIHYFWKKV